MKRLIPILLVLCFVGCLFGCVEKVPQEGLYIQTSKAFESLAFLSAVENDKLHQYHVFHGVDKEVIHDSLLDGKMDLAFVPPQMALKLYLESKGEIKPVAVNQGELTFIFERGAGLLNLTQLAGQEVLLYQKDGAEDVLLRAILKAYEIQDVQYRYPASRDELLLSLQENVAATAVLTEAEFLAAQADDAYIYPLFDLDWLWLNRPLANRLPMELYSEPVMSVVVVRDELMQKKREKVEQFLEALDASTAASKINAEALAERAEAYEILPKVVAEQGLLTFDFSYSRDEAAAQNLSLYLQELAFYLPEEIQLEDLNEDFFAYLK